MTGNTTHDLPPPLIYIEFTELEESARIRNPLAKSSHVTLYSISKSPRFVIAMGGDGYILHPSGRMAV